MKTGICLNMIIKNEAKNLARMFESLHSIIDYYIISDTGSTDNSIELVKNLGKKYKIDGIIESHPWKDFSHNRNIALEMANKALREDKHQCKWWLVFDPDEELIIEDPLFFEQLNENYSYCIPKQYNNIQSAPLLLVSFKQAEWEWKGEIHNFLHNSSSNKKTEILKGLSIKCHVFAGEKSKAFANQNEKSLKDIELLENELQIAIPSSENVHRYFSLANEYHEIGNSKKAIENFNIVLHYFDQKNATIIYFTHIQLGIIYFQFLKNQNQAIEHFRLAISTDNERKEAYYFLGKIHMLNKEFESAKKYLSQAFQIEKTPIDMMFYIDIYSWKTEFDLLLVLIQLQQITEVTSLLKSLIKNPFLPKTRVELLNSLARKLKIQ